MFLGRNRHGGNEEFVEGMRFIDGAESRAIWIGDRNIDASPAQRGLENYCAIVVKAHAVDWEMTEGPAQAAWMIQCDGELGNEQFVRLFGHSSLGQNPRFFRVWPYRKSRFSRRRHGEVEQVDFDAVCLRQSGCQLFAILFVSFQCGLCGFLVEIVDPSMVLRHGSIKCFCGNSR